MTFSTDELAVLAEQPRHAWRAHLEARCSDQGAIEAAMLWMATGELEAAPPSLGDRYELVEALDHGGTATIWRATDRLLGRAVAIKLFHDDAAAISRALREARAASDVVSDHVVRVLDVIEGEPAFIVMELVAEYDPRGELHLGRAAFDDRPRQLMEAVRWVLQAARGVADAHLRNVFHRDLNPRNLLITPLSRRARLVDFGLAASRHGRGRFGGTPAYMAPEQAIACDDEGARARLVALDIWGLGAIAYDLLAGHPPWPADRAWDALLDRPPPPLPRSLPRQLREIVMRMLAVRPADRYPSAHDVVAELAAFAAAQPTSFDRGAPVRARLWCKRNPQVALTGAVAVVLAGIVAASTWSLSRLRDERTTLTAELAARQHEQARLIANIARTRDELREAERLVEAKSHELAGVGEALTREREAYVELVAAKERALARASAERHSLLGRLEDLEDDRSVALSTGRLYERFWLAARKDADRAIRARGKLESERDAAIAEVRALTARLVELEHERAQTVADHPPDEPTREPTTEAPALTVPPSAHAE